MQARPSRQARCTLCRIQHAGPGWDPDSRGERSDRGVDWVLSDDDLLIGSRARRACDRDRAVGPGHRSHSTTSKVTENAHVAADLRGRRRVPQQRRRPCRCGHSVRARAGWAGIAGLLPACRPVEWRGCWPVVSGCSGWEQPLPGSGRHSGERPAVPGGTRPAGLGGVLDEQNRHNADANDTIASPWPPNVAFGREERRSLRRLARGCLAGGGRRPVT